MIEALTSCLAAHPAFEEYCIQLLYDKFESSNVQQILQALILLNKALDKFSVDCWNREGLAIWNRLRKYVLQCSHYGQIDLTDLDLFQFIAPPGEQHVELARKCLIKMITNLKRCGTKDRKISYASVETDVDLHDFSDDYDMLRNSTLAAMVSQILKGLKQRWQRAKVSPGLGCVGSGLQFDQNSLCIS